MNNKKQEATTMRKEGFSYSEISLQLGIAKSTLSSWLAHELFSDEIRKNNSTDAKKKWAESIIQHNKERSKNVKEKWNVFQNESASTIGKLSDRELLLVGSALYWAEGYNRGRWSLIFCNSNPLMVKIFLKFLEKICNVAIEKIRVQVQIHDNIVEEAAINYWMEVTNLSRNTFMKTMLQVSKSSKGKVGNRLLYGTFRIRINDVALVNQVKGWICGLAYSLEK